MKRSRAPFGQEVSATAGGGGSSTGRNDQNARSAAEMIRAGGDSGAGPAPTESGHSAPDFTHRVNTAISASSSLRLGGIWTSPSYRMTSISRLAFGSPG